jgi:hypothetical protein
VEWERNGSENIYLGIPLRRDGTIYVLPDDTIIKTWGRSKTGKRKRVKVALHSLRPARALSHVLLAGAVFFFVSFVFIMRKLNAWLELVGLHCDA